MNILSFNCDLCTLPFCVLVCLCVFTRASYCLIFDVWLDDYLKKINKLKRGWGRGGVGGGRGEKRRRTGGRPTQWITDKKI